MHVPLEEDDVQWLITYAASVRQSYESAFKSSPVQFDGATALVDKFDRAVSRVLSEGRHRFRAVDETHNELAIAAALVRDRDAAFVALSYEPALPTSAKTIDFRAETATGRRVYVDVKTIKPEPNDRWDQYERARREGWMPPNVQMELQKEWLGGELWHYAFAARSRMLGYAVELEEKIAESSVAASRALFTLAFCGGGFHWSEDELEDFVAFYVSGEHRLDDPFANLESRYIEEKGIRLTRAIDRFACLQRPQGEIFAKRLNWHVKPPEDSTFF